MRLIVLLVGVALSAAVASAAAPRSKADADAMLRKVAIIATHGLAETARKAPRRTAVTEREVNAYLAYHARNDIPAGVVDPEVTIAPDGQLTGRAIVDLDQVRQARRSNGFGVASLLTGRLPVEAAGRLRTANGVGQFHLERATVAGVPVPKMVLQEVVTYYSRTPENPAGIDLEAPFELPVGIREIQTQPGQAIVVQ